MIPEIAPKDSELIYFKAGKNHPWHRTNSLLFKKTPPKEKIPEEPYDPFQPPCSRLYMDILREQKNQVKLYPFLVDE